MRRKLKLLAALLLCAIALSASAGAKVRGPAQRYMWQTGQPHYKPSMKGSICWTSVQEPKYDQEDRTCKPLFHSMDLSTGKIKTRELNGWYLINSDPYDTGTLVARHVEDKLQIAQWSAEGKWIPFLECPFESSYPCNDMFVRGPRHTPVIAYFKGYLYYMMKDGDREWLRRDNLKGDVHDYAFGDFQACISPGGNVANYSPVLKAYAIETTEGKVYWLKVTKEIEIASEPIVWINDEILLVWTYDQLLDDYIMCEYAFKEKKLTPVINKDGSPIVISFGGYGESATYDPVNRRFVQLCWWGDAIYAVPVVIKLSDGKPAFLYETEHTDQYDEVCTHFDRVNWLIPASRPV